MGWSLATLSPVCLRLVGGTVFPCSTQQQAPSHWEGSHQPPPTTAPSLPVTVREVDHQHIWSTLPWKLVSENTISSQKYLPPSPFLHTTFRQKWEGGICSNIQFVSCIRLLPPFLIVFNMRMKSTITMTAANFRKNGSFAVQEISVACIDETRGTEATTIICGNRGQLHASSRSQCEQQNP